MRDLLMQDAGKIVETVHVNIEWIQSLDRNRDYFLIRTALVCHYQTTNWPATDNGKGYNRHLRPDQTPILSNTPDLRESFGWDHIDLEQKQRIVAAAAVYLKTGDPKADEWLGTDKMCYSVISGYRALSLLNSEAPDQFETLDVASWKRWSPVILCFPAIGDGETEIQRQLVATAFRNAPDTIIDVALSLVDRETNNKIARISMTLDLLRECHSDYLWDRLIARLTAPGLKADEAAPILSLLVSAGGPKALEFAGGLIPIPLPTDEDKRKLAGIAARELFFADGATTWPIVWRAIQSDLNFGKTVIREAAHLTPIHQTNLLGHLRERELSSLFIWLEQQFPTDDDPDLSDEGFGSGPRASVGFLR